VFWIVADESEDAIREELLTRFSTITNESLNATSKAFLNEAERTKESAQGIKAVALGDDLAIALTELADFELKEESVQFYKVLTEKSN
jgi:hypothetical protein